MFRIYFKDNGSERGDWNMEVEAATIGEVETIALLECRRRIKSKFIMLLYLTDLVYAVYDGLAGIGEVKIRSL